MATYREEVNDWWIWVRYVALIAAAATVALLLFFGSVQYISTLTQGPGDDLRDKMRDSCAKQFDAHVYELECIKFVIRAGQD